MRIDDILPALALPAGAVVNRWSDKKTLLPGARHPGDKQRIVNGIDSIHWLALISIGTSGVHPLVNHERNYSEIGVFAVTPRRGADIPLLVETLHGVIPQPAIIFYADETVTQVSLWHKRISRTNRHQFVLDGSVNRCPLGQPKTDALFLANLQWDLFPHFNPFVLYTSWHDRVYALKSARLTGDYTLLRTRDQLDCREKALDQYASLHWDRACHRKSRTSYFLPAERADLERKIKKVSEEMAVVVESLRSIGGGSEAAASGKSSAEEELPTAVGEPCSPILENDLAPLQQCAAHV